MLSAHFGRIAIGTRPDLSVVVPLLSSNHCVSDAVRYHRSITTAPDNSHTRYSSLFFSGAMQVRVISHSEFFFFLITHGDSLPPPFVIISSANSLDMLIFVISPQALYVNSIRPQMVLIFRENCFMLLQHFTVFSFVPYYKTSEIIQLYSNIFVY